MGQLYSRGSLTEIFAIGRPGAELPGRKTQRLSDAESSLYLMSRERSSFGGFCEMEVSKVGNFPIGCANAAGDSGKNRV